MKEVQNILEQMESIGLEQMDSVRLLKRFDSKYLIPVSLLTDVLKSVQKDYYVLEIEGVLVQDYRTVYYDTSDNDFYINHHNGLTDRIKVRRREYINSGMCFLEIKRKNNKGKTVKTRMESNATNTFFSYDELNFLRANTQATNELNESQLKEAVYNRFNRITLVNKAFNERCTIDINLKFSEQKKMLFITDLAVIELKQEKPNDRSPLFESLRSLHIYKQGFSKYCIGRALLDTSLKQNLFKSKLMRIRKIYDMKYANGA